jgi:hypothetical protein
MSILDLFLTVVVIGWVVGKVFKNIIYRSWLDRGSGMWWHYAVITFGLSFPIFGSTVPIRELEGTAERLWTMVVIMLAFIFSWFVSKRPSKLERYAIDAVPLTFQISGEEVLAAVKEIAIPRVLVRTTLRDYTVDIDEEGGKGTTNCNGMQISFVIDNNEVKLLE